MPKTRPIEYEPMSSDDRQQHQLFKARIRKRPPVPAERLQTNGWAAPMAGGRVGGATSIRGGNPGPIGSPMAGSTDGSAVSATFD